MFDAFLLHTQLTDTTSLPGRGLLFWTTRILFVRSCEIASRFHEVIT